MADPFDLEERWINDQTDETFSEWQDRQRRQRPVIGTFNSLLYPGLRNQIDYFAKDWKLTCDEDELKNNNRE
jgi:hypothetical protein